MKDGKTKLVSFNSDGTGTGNASSDYGNSGSGAINPAISADGRYVAFSSLATNLVKVSDTNERNDIFVRDVVSGTTSLVSVNNSGKATGNDSSYSPLLSSD